MTGAPQLGQLVACLCAPRRLLSDCFCLATSRRKVFLLLLVLTLITFFSLLRSMPKDGNLDGSKIIHLITMAADNNNKTFDVVKVDKLFSSCLGEADIISILCYIDAFQELCKLFRLFGTIFGFVTSDVEEKTEILRVYHQEQPQPYSTVQSMLEFEVSNELTDNKKKPSGARTLLRLHRAMEFISGFLLKLRDSDNSMRFSTCVGEAYDTTLAKHHPWLIRKAVQMALYMLPSRQDLLKKMGIEDNENNMQRISDLISKLNVIFDVIEKLYAKDDLLQLP